MFGFDAVAGFTHHVESAFDLVRKGKVAMTAALADIALAGKDHIRNLIERPEASMPKPARRSWRGSKRRSAATPRPKPRSPPKRRPVSAPAAPTAKWRVQFRLPVDALATGTNPLLLIDELRSLGKAVVTPLLDKIPPLAALNATEIHIGWDVTLETDKPKSALEDVLHVRHGRDGAEDRAARRTEGPHRFRCRRARTRGCRRAEAAAAAQPAKNATEALKSGGSIRVPAERLDNLMDRVGEMVIAQIALEADRRGPARTASSNRSPKRSSASRWSSATTTMGVRMVPIASCSAGSVAWSTISPGSSARNLAPPRPARRRSSTRP